MTARAALIRTALSAAALISLATGCVSVAQVTTLASPECHQSFSAAVARILAAQGESSLPAQQLAESTTTELQVAGLGPRPFLVEAPSGVDYSFFVQEKGSACLLRLYGRQKGFVSYTNNISYIATEPLAPCQCAD